MKVIKKYTLSPLETGLLLILIVQFGLIVFTNLTLTDMNLDCDNAKMFRHIIEMWRNKTIAIPNWTYVSTLELDCASLFALPIYGITKNIYIAYGLSNVILTAIFLVTLFFLFHGKAYFYPLLCANLILIPYRIGMLDYFNMMFFCGAQYIIKVLVPILLIAILLYIEKTPNIKLTKSICLPYALLYVFLLFIVSISSGTYVTFCGLVPIFVTYLCHKFFKEEKLPRNTTFLLVASLLCLIVGNCLNMHIMGGTRAGGMTFCNVQSMFANTNNCLWGFFELFGGMTIADDVAILSYDGIVIFSRFCLVALLLFCGIIALGRCIRKRAGLQILLLLSVFIWNYIILNITNTRAGSETYEYRYHLIGAIPLICVACILVVDEFLKLSRRQQKVLCFGTYAVLLFLCGTAYISVFSHGEQNAELKELTEYCRDLNVDHAYMYNASNDSDVCRTLDLDTQYIYMDEEGSTYVYDYYKAYVHGVVQPLNSIVIVNNKDYALGDSFTIPNYLLEKFAEVGNRSLYRFVLEPQ